MSKPNHAEMSSGPIVFFNNNFEIKHKLGKYLTGSCKLVSDLQFSLKFFLKIAFVWEISPK